MWHWEILESLLGGLAIACCATVLKACGETVARDRKCSSPRDSFSQPLYLRGQDMAWSLYMPDSEVSGSNGGNARWERAFAGPRDRFEPWGHYGLGESRFWSIFLSFWLFSRIHMGMAKSRGPFQARVVCARRLSAWTLCQFFARVGLFLMLKSQQLRVGAIARRSA